MERKHRPAHETHGQAVASRPEPRPSGVLTSYRNSTKGAVPADLAAAMRGVTDKIRQTRSMAKSLREEIESETKLLADLMAKIPK